MRQIAFTPMTALGLLALIGPEPAIAAAGDDQAEMAPAASDIVVTARRREEKLQDVPVAVTVLSGNVLQSQNLQSMVEFQRKIPSLTITPVNGRGVGAAVQIRGQRQAEVSVASDPSVAVYINEVTSARPTGLDTTIFDLESVQVLKGPQGTLFGRNSTGGALLITTRKPGKEFGGYVRGYIEDPIATGFEAAVNVPVSDAIRFRLAGNYQWREGYSKVVNTGRHLDDRNRYSLRGTLDLLPTSSIRSTFVAEYFKADENGLATYAFNYQPGLIRQSPQTQLSTVDATIRAVINSGYPAAYAESQALGFHELKTSAPGRSKSKAFSVTNTTSLEVSDALTIKNIAGYRYLRASDALDADGTQANLYAFDAYIGGRQYSEELQLQGEAFDRALNWTVGGFYFKETGFDNVRAYLSKAPFVGTFSNNNFTAENRSTSAFANATYTLPFEHRTRVYGGVRYTHDVREIVWKNRALSGACTVVGASADCEKPASVNFSKVTWQAGLDHEFTPGVMGYGTVSTGYRTGGLNGRATSLASQLPYDPETLTNYEVGLKSNFDLSGAPVTLNLAGFVSKYRDIQRSLTVNLGTSSAPIPVSTVVNAASATVKGFEVEFSVRPADNFEVNARYSYVDAKYDEFAIFNPNTGGDIDVSDYKFAGVSPHQWGAGISWTFASSDTAGDFRLAGDFSYSDGFELNDVNLPGNQTNDSTVVNTSLEWAHLLGSQATGTLYVKNLLNEKYLLGGLALTSAFDISGSYHAPPRVIGLSLKVPFGTD